MSISMTVNDLVDEVAEDSTMKIAHLRDNEDDINAILKAVSNGTVTSIVPAKNHISIGVCGGRNELAKIYSALRKIGLQPAIRPEVGETSYLSWWSNAACGKVLFLSFTSTQCVRVQTGTRMVEQPVYEVRCQ